MFEVGRHTESTATKKKGVRHGEELAWDQELEIDLDSSSDAELHVRPRSTCCLHSVQVVTTLKRPDHAIRCSSTMRDLLSCRKQAVTRWA